jgi:hypothetical protein
VSAGVVSPGLKCSGVVPVVLVVSSEGKPFPIPEVDLVGQAVNVEVDSTDVKPY